MDTIIALCGHHVPVLGGPGSKAREQCELNLCRVCNDAMVSEEMTKNLIRRLRQYRVFTMQLAERVAICSALLGRAAEKRTTVKGEKS